MFILRSASAITRRTDEIAEDIEAQLLERINESLWYAIQDDECTDVHSRATELVFVQCVFQEDVHEDMLCALFCQPTPQLQSYSSL